MAVWSATKATIKRNIESIAKRALNVASLTQDDSLIISDCINLAMQDLCQQRGISNWRFLTRPLVATTTPNVNYVDLTPNVHRVKDGTVRLVGEDVSMIHVSTEWIADRTTSNMATGVPTHYAFVQSGDPETLRMRLWPTPDAAYNISYEGEMVVEQDGVSAFPSWLHGLVAAQAIVLALEAFGLPQLAALYERRYEERLQNAYNSERGTGPIHIRRVAEFIPKRDIQDRKPD